MKVIDIERNFVLNLTVTRLSKDLYWIATNKAIHLKSTLSNPLILRSTNLDSRTLLLRVFKTLIHINIQQTKAQLHPLTVVTSTIQQNRPSKMEILCISKFLLHVLLTHQIWHIWSNYRQVMCSRITRTIILTNTMCFHAVMLIKLSVSFN